MRNTTRHLNGRTSVSHGGIQYIGPAPTRESTSHTKQAVSASRKDKGDHTTEKIAEGRNESEVTGFRTELQVLQAQIFQITKTECGIIRRYGAVIVSIVTLECDDKIRDVEKQK